MALRTLYQALLDSDPARLRVIAGQWTVDLTGMGVDKLLGSGRIGTPVAIKVAEASAKAKEKLKAAGGELIEEEGASEA